MIGKSNLETHMTMKMRLLTAFSIVTLIGCSPAFTSQKSLSMVLQAENDIVRIGEPTKIDITLKNLSNDPIPLDIEDGTKDRAELDYTIEMTYKNGESVARTDYGNSLLPYDLQPKGSVKCCRISSPDFEDLNAHDEIHESASLDKIFVISEPGLYFVKVSRTLNTVKPTQNLTSNTISLTIRK